MLLEIPVMGLTQNTFSRVSSGTMQTDQERDEFDRCSLDAAMGPKKHFAPDANAVCRFVMAVR